MKALATIAAILAAASALAAPLAQVTYDEDGNISPPGASNVIATATSAIVEVNLAEAKAQILTNVVAIANKTLQDAATLFTKYSNYSIVDLYATGILEATTNGANPSITITAFQLSSTNTSAYIYADLTWQYVDGSFNTPEIIAATAVTNSTAFTPVTMTEPEQISYGETVRYKSTVTIPTATFGTSSCFFKVRANLNTPIDDGRVFDIFSTGGGVNQKIRFRPSHVYDITVTQGRITGVEVVE